MKIKGNQLGNTIKKHRFASNRMTQEELAIQTGVSRQTIVSIEKGIYNPSVVLALKLSDVFKVPVEELFILKQDT
jgi:putative transcriptional regulator